MDKIITAILGSELLQDAGNIKKTKSENLITITYFMSKIKTN